MRVIVSTLRHETQVLRIPMRGYENLGLQLHLKLSAQLRIPMRGYEAARTACSELQEICYESP